MDRVLCLHCPCVSGLTLDGLRQLNIRTDKVQSEETKGARADEAPRFTEVMKCS